VEFPVPKKTKGKISEKGKKPLKRASKKKLVLLKNRPAADIVFGIVKRNKKGIGMVKLKEQTGFDEKKLYNIIYRLKKLNKIKSLSRGVYGKV
jgi:hypothetical protein